MEKTEKLNVTSVDSLKEYAKGTLVVLPPFAEGQPFVARMRRPSMLKLIKEGQIPNSLILKANELFADTSSALDTDDEGMMGELFDVIDVIASASFLEPTYEEIKESGMDLTDDEHIFILNYSERGVKALEFFRDKQEN